MYGVVVEWTQIQWAARPISFKFAPNLYFRPEKMHKTLFEKINVTLIYLNLGW